MTDFNLQFVAKIPNVSEKEREWLLKNYGFLLWERTAEEREEEPEFLRKIREEESGDIQFRMYGEHKKTSSVSFEADERGSPAQVAIFVQAFLREFRPHDCFVLTWAETCSKMHEDGFSGGAVFVTSEMIHNIQATDWAANMREEYLRKSHVPR